MHKKTYKNIDLSVRVFEIKDKTVNKLVIPDTIKIGTKSYKVTEIFDYAFDGTKITSVTIGKNVKDIYRCAFIDCKNLKTVTLKSKNCEVSSNAFMNCPKLTKFSGIKNATFINKELEYKLISNKMTLVGATSLWNSSGITILSELSIGAKDYPVEVIGKNAFAGNTNIRKLRIPNSVKIIQSKAFANCKNLSDITFENYHLSKGGAVAGDAFRNIASEIYVFVPKAQRGAYSLRMYSMFPNSFVTLNAYDEVIGED